MDAAAIERGFEAAATAAPDELCEQRLRIAGAPVEWRVVGSRLAARTLRPMEHLVDADPGEAPPELVVSVWDGEATGVGLPVSHPPDGQTYRDDGAVTVHATEGAVTVYDRRARRITAWRAKAEAGVDESWRPLGWALPLWCVDRGISVVHCGLVAAGDLGILLVGNGGAGKSTTTLACVAAGLGFLGDDFVAVQWGDPDIGHSLAAGARVTAETLDRYPSLAVGRLVDDDDVKQLQILGTTRAMRTSVPIRRIFVLRFGGGHSPARPGEVLGAFAPSSLMNFAGGGSWGMSQIAAMARRVPASWLDISAGPERAAEQIATMAAAAN